MQDVAEQAEGEKAALPQLAATTSAYLEPGGRCHLVPRAWLQEWRAFVNQGVKRALYVIGIHAETRGPKSVL